MSLLPASGRDKSFSYGLENLHRSDGKMTVMFLNVAFIGFNKKILERIEGGIRVRLTAQYVVEGSDR
jgi:hypothetical protein